MCSAPETPDRDRNPARHRAAEAKDDPAAGREYWRSSIHSLRAACENLATPSCPPSRHRECSSDSLLQASLQNERPVYLQGTSSIQTLLLTKQPVPNSTAALRLTRPST